MPLATFFSDTNESPKLTTAINGIYAAKLLRWFDQHRPRKRR